MSAIMETAAQPQFIPQINEVLGDRIGNAVDDEVAFARQRLMIGCWGYPALAW